MLYEKEFSMKKTYRHPDGTLYRVANHRGHGHLHTFQKLNQDGSDWSAEPVPGMFHKPVDSGRRLFPLTQDELTEWTQP